MTRYTLIVLIILTTLFGCDFSKQVKDNVDDSVKDTKAGMNIDITNARSNFTESYKKALRQSKDSIFSNRVTDLYSNLTMTSKYIDSLRKEMDTLDDMDTKNVELIKEKFLTEGVADSVFSKVRYSYSLAINIALAYSTKSRLIKAQKNYIEKNKKQFFELNSPLGVNMILYGIESELIKDGTSSLFGYIAK